MNFKKIDMKNHNRKEYFNLYFKNIPCTYSMSVNIDITKLLSFVKANNLKFFPVILYGITRLVNSHKEFRMSLDSDGSLGCFDSVNPSYTVFHKDTEMFSNIWTEYNEDFYTFYENYINDIKVYGDNKSLNAKPLQGDNAKPLQGDNMFNVSAIPWTTFTGFNLNLQKGYDYLLPIFTIGKYQADGEKTILPLALQVHHAVCDGFHTSRFVNELQDWANSFIV